MSKPALAVWIKFKALVANQRRGSGLGTRLGIYTFLWWILSDGDPTAWVWGIPAIIAAAVVSPLPPAASWKWRLMGLLRFIPIFFWLSLLSGLDVAWRALHPQRPLEPAFIEYPWLLPPGPARIFLANVISLIPGTLGVQIKEQSLTIHVLKSHVRVIKYIHLLEHHIIDLFGLSGVSGGK